MLNIFLGIESKEVWLLECYILVLLTHFNIFEGMYNIIESIVY